MDKSLSFDDVLILPEFSFIASRKDVDTSQSFLGQKIKLPIVSSNMDSVTDSKMSVAMLNNGAMACLHRFCSIEDNVKMFNNSTIDDGYTCRKAWVSIGLGDNELERAKALIYAGAETFVIDVAHGASMEVVRQTNQLSSLIKGNGEIIVGNFATKETIYDFMFHLGNNSIVGAYKVGIGGGSACTTRVVTGCGLPTFGSVFDCATSGYPIIADGGIRNSGDVCKAIAAGASMVMLGGMLAGCDESPSEIVYLDKSGREYSASRKDDIVPHVNLKPLKKYRGSASAESYVVQNKVAEWRSAEGESFLVPYAGTVKDVLQQIEGGLRSSMSYVGASNFDEFRKCVKFVQVTNAGAVESRAHGKSRF